MKLQIDNVVSRLTSQNILIILSNFMLHYIINTQYISFLSVHFYKYPVGQGYRVTGDRGIDSDRGSKFKRNVIYVIQPLIL